MTTVTRCFWTKKDEDILISLYKNGNPGMKKVLSVLTDKTTNGVYKKVHRLRKLGLIPENFVRKDVVTKDMLAADYSTKVKKRALEKDAVKVVDQKGGWFGIPGPALKEHWEVFSEVLRPKSPFIVVEESGLQLSRLRKSLETMPRIPKKRITIIKGDLFNVLKGLHTVNPEPDVPLYSYGHLDFCKTTEKLCSKFALQENLKWLSQWSQLKDTFFLDISVCTRPFGPKEAVEFFQHIVPFNWRINGWKVSDPRNCKNKYYKIYQDSAAQMVNAMYKMERIKRT